MIPLPLIAGIIGGIILIVILASGYVKAKPDEAILISGYKKKPRIITGTATIKIPFLERRDSL
ncbi:MAG TPA: flotillin family protein, partial [Clostridiales bacterium]|nr:flotillin family protein [Clostridiales bacterium]